MIRLLERARRFDTPPVFPATVFSPVESSTYNEERDRDSNCALAERIEVGLFTAERGRDAFDKSHVLLMERQPIRSERQVLNFVSDRKPLYAGVDPQLLYRSELGG